MNNELILGTNDIVLFKRCRRKWNLSSRMRQNLVQKTDFNHNLWFGTGFHFALEDYHGYRRFKKPSQALQAYFNCFDEEKDLNEKCKELKKIGPGMLDYYSDIWLPARNYYKTHVVNGVPQVEVKFKIKIPELSKFFGKPVYYKFTLDRVVTDCYNRLWVMEYKTVSSFDEMKLETDSQATRYAWGAEFVYNEPIVGVIWVQFKKENIQEPKILKNGSVSTNKNQNTTYFKYRKALIETCGSIENASDAQKETLKMFRAMDTEVGDNFIRYNLIQKNNEQKKNEYKKIINEACDILNPKLRIYPNPTRDCAWDCPFRTVCLAMDDGGDWQHLLKENFIKEPEEDDSWRAKIKYPQEQNQLLQK